MNHRRKRGALPAHLLQPVSPRIDKNVRATRGSRQECRTLCKAGALASSGRTPTQRSLDRVGDKAVVRPSDRPSMDEEATFQSESLVMAESSDRQHLAVMKRAWILLRPHLDDYWGRDDQGCV
jgi:hypothetical protein